MNDAPSVSTPDPRTAPTGGGSTGLEHVWVDPVPPVNWPHCQVCGVIQRRDGGNSPCRGDMAPIELRAPSTGLDEAIEAVTALFRWQDHGFLCPVYNEQRQSPPSPGAGACDCAVRSVAEHHVRAAAPLIEREARRDELNKAAEELEARAHGNFVEEHFADWLRARAAAVGRQAVSSDAGE